ncbi:EndoU domain-containing protein [Streptococcus sp. 210928-DFI.4.42]|uniref:EndoU domain-containing protein n=1 Tax=Streptococcus TaxID=1301 RepID=UPI001D0758D5|nr:MULTISPECIES: EndoU domain-containing protein [Streptococcus]MCB6479818.1 EndoU domain-containing protein [Streptococcus parasanguinis]MCB7060958.1 EndoU domain-containing protein [Streptococcus sp. 210928-DFI.4.42]MCQ5186713.1 EndoU domain-containing protein [Streptococcus parasanguinis]
MSIDMYLESARSQATSLSSISAQCVQQNIELIKVLENFVAEEELKGHAYDSAKAHITSTVIPLIQGIVLYQESLAEECQKFVSQYTSDVDSKSWRQVDLEEKIREADQKISNLRQLMETKSDDKISAFLNLSLSIAVLEGAKQKLQKILISLLTFNAVSPTIFLNSEQYLLAVQNGFAQAAQSWDAASGTYLPPSNGADLSWKQTISLGWQKRQAVLNKVKNPKVETLEEKLSKMSRAELEEEYGSVIQSYKRFLTMGQGDNVTATMDYEDVKLIWKRYNEVKNDHLGLLPSELAKVDPKFKKRIDAMDQEALEEAYPELKTLISMAHVNPYAQLFKSETERANYDYLLDRYFLLDSQKMLSWRDPAFQTKYDYYIIEEGIDPFTGKPATQEEINRAKDIKKVRTVTESFQLASTLYTSYVGYNQYYNKPYTTFSDVFSKVKGKIPFSNRKIESWNRNVSEFKMYNLDDLANLKHTENFTEKSLSHIFEGDINRRGQAGGYHYDMVEGTSGKIIEGTKGPALNDAGVYEAKVEVNGTLKKANGGNSTFFPDHMSPQEVVDTINEAYEARVFDTNSRNIYEGISKNGMKITMYLDSNEKIISAFPSSK